MYFLISSRSKLRLQPEIVEGIVDGDMEGRGENGRIGGFIVPLIGNLEKMSEGKATKWLYANLNRGEGLNKN